MIFVLERAERIRDALEIIRLAVRPVVHRINDPGVAGALVGRLANSVHDRIAQVHVSGRHVDLGAKHVSTVLEFSRPHAAEQIEILFDGSMSIGALATRLGERAAIFAHLIRGEAVDICLAFPDELLGPLIQLLEVIGGMVKVLAPVESQPSNVALDLVDILLGFLDRVGVVEAQIAVPTELLRDTEIDADGLGMADMQPAVRLGWKTGDDRPAMLPGDEILRDDFTDEVFGWCFGTAFRARAGHGSTILAYGRMTGQCGPGIPFPYSRSGTEKRKRRARCCPRPWRSRRRRARVHLQSGWFCIEGSAVAGSSSIPTTTAARPRSCSRTRAPRSCSIGR